MEVMERLVQRAGIGTAPVKIGTEKDLLTGRIFAREGDVFLVASGYPEVDEEGNETFSDFRVVDLSFQFNWEREIVATVERESNPETLLKLAKIARARGWSSGFGRAWFKALALCPA